MKYRLVVLILFSSLCLSNEQSLKNLVESNFGSIDLLCKNIDECQLVVNDQQTNHSIANFDFKKLIVKHWRHENFELYMLVQSHGDGCPSMYFLLKLESHQKFKVTDDFGNCNEYDSIQFNSEALIIEFQDRKIDSRPAITYNYDIKTLIAKKIK